MSIDAAHVGPYPLPAIPVRRHWHAVGSALTAALHKLAAAATVGAASDGVQRPARYAYLERAEMAREMGRL